MNEYSNFVDGNILDYSTDELKEEIENTQKNCPSIFLTVEQLKRLENSLNFTYKKKLEKINIFLYMNSPTELTYSEYKYFYNKYKLYHIFVKGFSKTKGTRDEEYNKSDNIDPKIMLFYLKELNKLIKDLPVYSDIDFETDIKTVCLLANRIINKINYDADTATQRSLDQYKHKYYVPNEIIGLLEKKTVCRGYSGIFRDCLKLLGFEVININGFNKNKSGHEWNQVKISRNWFNCDLTWDTFNILNKKTPIFLLTDDNDFYAFYKSENGLNISHSLYLNECNVYGEFAYTNIPRDKINEYLYSKENMILKKKFTKHI